MYRYERIPTPNRTSRMVSQSRFRLCVLTLSVLSPFVVIVYVLTNALSADTVNAANSSGPRAVPTLQQLFILARHGNRGPVVTFPTFPYQCNDTDVWPYGEGQLTNRGRVQMYNLGKKFRSLYDGFLDEHFRQEDMLAQSTLVDRTMMSASQFLAGLYPPKGFQVWNKHLMWQPIPIFITEKDHSMMVPVFGLQTCPRFRQIQNESLIRYKNENGADLLAFLQSVQPYTGITIDSGSPTVAMNHIWESFFCADNEGLTLPAWTKSVYPEPMISIYEKIYKAYTIATDTMIRLLQGQLFQEIMGLMGAKINGTLEPNRRLYFYSGHDNTIKGVLGILGLGDSGGIARTGSAIILELHRGPQAGQHHVQVLYIDGGSKDLEPSFVNIPGCDFPCDFQLLSKITEKYYNITDYESECQIRP
uniref:acid phosphatase n=1 Tax=Cuerna arida TaxID=1464854 RepID=A0A1B6GZA2_9HEMI